MANQTVAHVLRYLRHLASDKAGDEQDDSELLNQFVAHRDEAAFAVLLKRHGPLVLGVCRQVLRDAHAAEDVFQAAFLVLARKAGSIRRQESVAAWLHRVALNLAQTARTANARRKAHERQAVLMSVPHRVDEAALRDWQPLLHEEVDRLPQKYRVLIVLCYIEAKTHNEAARQLGLPLGTVKGRLARARDLLRTRLVRRGLALSAGGVCWTLQRSAALGSVPPVLLGHTFRAAMLYAAGGTIGTSAVSAQALALAKGALPTMNATKLVVMILAVGLMAVGVTLAARAMGLGDEAGLPAENHGGSPAAGVPAVEKGARIEQGVHLARAPERGDEDIQLTLSSTQKEYRTGEAVDLTLTIKNNGKKEFSYYKAKLRELNGFDMIGPDGKQVKDKPNPVEFGGPADYIIVKAGEAVTIKDDLRHINLSINISKVPDTQAYLRHMYYPMEAAGIYRLHISFGKATSNVLTVKVVGKNVRDTTAESKAVRVNGVDCSAFVDKQVRVPAVGTIWPATKTDPWLDLGLRVANASDKPIVIYDKLIRYSVSLPDGTPLRMAGGTDEGSRMNPWTIEPGKEMALLGHSFLQWTPEGKTLALYGQENTDFYRGVYWSFEGLKPGKYLLSAEYTLTKSPDPAKPVWLGTVKTHAVEFEVIDSRAGLNESKAVRVGGVDFQAVVEPKRSAPKPGGRQFIDLGFGINNPTDKTLVFNLFDTLLPVLKSSDGTAIKCEQVRLRTAPALPVLVGPRQVETVLYRAGLLWQPDGKALRLFGPDRSGGTWYFDGLVPGKYQLSFEYKNTEDTQRHFLKAAMALPPRVRPGPLEAGQAYWLGMVLTETVEFEIIAP
jgi:RNA polymerase sigma factor (sigma-70 family)